MPDAWRHAGRILQRERADAQIKMHRLPGLQKAFKLLHDTRDKFFRLHMLLLMAHRRTAMQLKLTDSE